MYELNWRYHFSVFIDRESVDFPFKFSKEEEAEAENINPIKNNRLTKQEMEDKNR